MEALVHKKIVLVLILILIVLVLILVNEKQNFA